MAPIAPADGVDDGPDSPRNLFLVTTCHKKGFGRP
jgi:hypothetical protein